MFVLTRVRDVVVVPPAAFAKRCAHPREGCMHARAHAHLPGRSQTELLEAAINSKFANKVARACD